MPGGGSVRERPRFMPRNRGEGMGPVRVPGMQPFGNGDEVAGGQDILSREVEEIKDRLMGRFTGRMGERQAAFEDREAERRAQFEQRAAGMPDFENRMDRYEARAENRATRFGERMEAREERMGQQMQRRAESRARMRSARDRSRGFRSRRGTSTAPGVTGAPSGGMAPSAESA